MSDAGSADAITEQRTNVAEDISDNAGTRIKLSGLSDTKVFGRAAMRQIRTSYIAHDPELAAMINNIRQLNL